MRLFVYYIAFNIFHHVVTICLQFIHFSTRYLNQDSKMSFCGLLLSSVRGSEHIEVMPYFCFILLRSARNIKLISKRLRQNVIIGKNSEYGSKIDGLDSNNPQRQQSLLMGEVSQCSKTAKMWDWEKLKGR